MRLRVLDDDRPGYARLAFDGPLPQTTLALSVRSLTQAAFLGPDGKWQRSPHFFAASRIGGTAASALFRVGPEVVNHLWEFDAVEFATEDGSLHAETTWENAIPQMAEGQRRSTRYGEAGQAPPVGEGQPAAEPSAESPAPAPAEPPAPAPAANFAQERAQESSQEISPPPDTSPPPQEGTAPAVAEPSRRTAAAMELLSRYRLPLLGALGVLVLVAVLYPFLPCGWPGKGQCVLREVDAARRARQCADERARAHRDCDIGQDCIAPYLAEFAAGQARAELEDRRKAADDVCRQTADRAQEDTVLREARACAADAPRACATPACYAAYLRAYGQSGVHKEDARKEAAALAQKCPAPEPGANEAVALRFARQCARGPQRCAAPNCYADYLAKFGATGKYAIEGKAEAAQLDADCHGYERQAVDDTLWKTARTCAATAQRCAVKTCYRTYNDLFGTTGRHSVDARREIARAESDCSHATTPSAIDGGLPVGLGDTYEDIRRAYGTTKTPSACDGCPDHPKMLRLDDRGLWFFFDAAGKINLIRFDPPWTGSVQSIRLGDPSSKIERLLGVPNDGDGPNVGSGPYYYVAGGDKRYFYRRGGAMVATYLLDASDKVEAILIP